MKGLSTIGSFFLMLKEAYNYNFLIYLHLFIQTVDLAVSNNQRKLRTVVPISASFQSSFSTFQTRGNTTSGNQHILILCL